MVVYDAISKSPVLVSEHSFHLAVAMISQGSVLSVGVAFALVVDVDDANACCSIGGLSLFVCLRQGQIIGHRDLVSGKCWGAPALLLRFESLPSNFVIAGISHLELLTAAVAAIEVVQILPGYGPCASCELVFVGAGTHFVVGLSSVGCQVAEKAARAFALPS